MVLQDRVSLRNVVLSGLDLEGHARKALRQSVVKFVPYTGSFGHDGPEPGAHRLESSRMCCPDQAEQSYSEFKQVSGAPPGRARNDIYVLRGTKQQGETSNVARIFGAHSADATNTQQRSTIEPR